VTFWYSNGHKADAINDKLKDYFGATAPPYSTVTYWCRKLKLKCDILVIRRGPGRPLENDLDNVILDALNEFPFHSLRSPRRVLKIPLSTIRDRLIIGGCVVKHLKWAPHMLTAEHKEQRVQSAKNLFKTILLRVGTHGVILQTVAKVGFIYPLIMKPFGCKKETNGQLGREESFRRKR
jgi:hypothetical protein